MKALTLTQPYAALVALGAKRIETRSWATTYRGRLAIHAAKGLQPVGGKRGLVELVRSQPFASALFPGWHAADDDATLRAFDFGAVVAICDLIDIVPTDELLLGSRMTIEIPTGETYQWELTSQEYAFGDYGPHRFGWLLANLRCLPAPIPAKGALGLWEWKQLEGIVL